MRDSTERQCLALQICGPLINAGSRKRPKINFWIISGTRGTRYMKLYKMLHVYLDGGVATSVQAYRIDHFKYTMHSAFSSLIVIGNIENVPP